MLVFLFLLVLAAMAGVLGAILKAVAVVILAVVAATAILAWLGWRSIRRTLEVAREGDPPLGTTTITIGRARRDEPDAFPADGARDDRY